VELQELARQRRVEQVQLSEMLERFPHYVMVLNAKDLTIEAVNAAYKHLLGSREVKGLPMTEIFSGKEIDELIKSLKTAARENKSGNTGPIQAGIYGPDAQETRFVHTVVPIADDDGSNVDRIFIYSERSDNAVWGGGKSSVTSHNVVALTDRLLQHLTIVYVQLSATITNRHDAL